MARRTQAAGAILGALVLVALVLGGCSEKSSRGPQRSAASPTSTSSDRPSSTTATPVANSSLAPTPTVTTIVSVAGATQSGASIVAEALVAKVPVHSGMSAAARVVATLNNPNEDRAPLVLLVEQSQSGWLLVDLPVRPNGSQGWIQASLVRLTLDPYRIVIERRAHQLTLYKNDEIAMQVPVGIGTTSTPTPGGTFYIKELLQPPTPYGPYGPYAFGLSGFSDVLKSFAGGNGVIGLHGTNEPQYVGKDVSHGCIRLYNADILKLVELLPLGTPVEIAA